LREPGFMSGKQCQQRPSSDNVDPELQKKTAMKRNRNVFPEPRTEEAPVRPNRPVPVNISGRHGRTGAAPAFPQSRMVPARGANTREQSKPAPSGIATGAGQFNPIRCDPRRPVRRYVL